MIDSIKKMDCTGCKMCSDICLKKAIAFREDREGFWYPVVDNKKCIRCGKCIRQCPSLNDRSNKECFEPKVYAAWNRNEEVRIKSTSGGLFKAFADKILLQGGMAAGCAYTEDYKSCYHMITDDPQKLEKIMGSKYFQSDTNGIYQKTVSALKAGRKVLFCGTPCQISALNQAVGEERAGLITIDFVCRGINSPKVFKKYVQDCENKYHSKIKKVQLKNKKKGWTRLGTCMEFENGRQYYRDRVTDPWVNGYVVGNLFMRPCCSECKYKEKVRIADISIGDFWGLESSNENLFKGISLVLVNSEKGRALFESVKEDIVFHERSYSEAVKGNRCLLVSAPMGRKRADFFDRIDDAGFEQLVWELIGENKLSIWNKELKYTILEWKRRIKNGYFRKNTTCL